MEIPTIRTRLWRNRYANWRGTMEEDCAATSLLIIAVSVSHNRNQTELQADCRFIALLESFYYYSYTE